MTDKIEGTLILEGLIEGPLPPFPDAESKLQDWAHDTKKIRLTLRFDAGRFSALPSADPIHVPATGDDASADIAEALADLLRLFPPLEKRQVFSTLRSTEWRHKLEIKTMYAVGPDGRPATHQERAVVQTVAPQTPLAPKELLIRAGIGLAVAIAVLAISALFIDYPKLWRSLTASVEPVHVAVDNSDFAPYLQLEVKSLDRKNGTLILQLTRTPLYPTNEFSLDTLYAAPPETSTTIPSTLPAALPEFPATLPSTFPATNTSPAKVLVSMPVFRSLLRRRLAIDALAKGTVYLNLYDDHANYLGQIPLRIADLQSHPTLETSVPAPILSNHFILPTTITLSP